MEVVEGKSEQDLLMESKQKVLNAKPQILQRDEVCKIINNEFKIKSVK
jgi:hypothetical protein